MNEGLLSRRPERIIKKLGRASQVCLLSSHDIFSRIRNKRMVIAACNIRIRHVVPGIMRAADEADAIIAFELARSEGHLKDGYTGQTPEAFFDMLVSYAETLEFRKPFFIHADHTTVKDTSAIEFNLAQDLIEAEIEAGFTSFAIDASTNQLADDLNITTRLSKMVLDEGYGLEVQVGEVGPAGREALMTTVDEALAFISGLNERGISPDLLAINNGAKHGNYLPGEERNVDLKRTELIYEAIKGYSTNIAQHGITGIPLDILRRLADCGVRKANIATEWQNIAHRYLPRELLYKMKQWCKKNDREIKFATKPFKDEIDNIDMSYRKEIEGESYLKAKEYLEAFRAEGSATYLAKSFAE